MSLIWFRSSSEARSAHSRYFTSGVTYMLPKYQLKSLWSKRGSHVTLLCSQVKSNGIYNLWKYWDMSMTIYAACWGWLISWRRLVQKDNGASQYPLMKRRVSNNARGRATELATIFFLKKEPFLVPMCSMNSSESCWASMRKCFLPLWAPIPLLSHKICISSFWAILSPAQRTWPSSRFSLSPLSPYNSMPCGPVGSNTALVVVWFVIGFCLFFHLPP